MRPEGGGARPAVVEHVLTVAEFQVVKRSDVAGVLIRHFGGHTMQCSEQQLGAVLRRFFEANF